MNVNVKIFNSGKKMRIELLENLSYMYLADDETLFVTAKKGFECDGASIPKALWSILGSPLSGMYRRAAIIHDALYATHAVDRKMADDVFYKMMREDGVGWFKALAMYRGVRLFGGKAWRENLRSSIKWKSFVEVKHAYFDF